jgi:hypothetical protein
MPRRVTLPPRRWLNVEDAARYVGIKPNDIRGAIVRGELDAYDKPLTEPDREGRVKHAYRMHMDDLDAWVRTHWAKAGAYGA